jgi:hypothetical protein
MGPIQYAADCLEWAKRDIVTMTLNGPSIGQMICRRHTADDIEWVRCCDNYMPLTVLNGPSVAETICCRLHCMGPALILRGATDCLGWARCCSNNMSPIIANGPTIIPNMFYGLEWA